MHLACLLALERTQETRVWSQIAAEFEKRECMLFAITVSLLMLCPVLELRICERVCLCECDFEWPLQQLIVRRRRRLRLSALLLSRPLTRIAGFDSRLGLRLRLFPLGPFARSFHSRRPTPRRETEKRETSLTAWIRRFVNTRGRRQQEEGRPIAYLLESSIA